MRYSLPLDVSTSIPYSVFSPQWGQVFSIGLNFGDHPHVPELSPICLKSVVLIVNTFSRSHHPQSNVSSKTSSPCNISTSIVGGAARSPAQHRQYSLFKEAGKVFKTQEELLKLRKWAQYPRRNPQTKRKMCRKSNISISKNKNQTVENQKKKKDRHYIPTRMRSIPAATQYIV